MKMKTLKKLILIGFTIIVGSQSLLAQAAEANPQGVTQVSLDGAWQMSAADKNDWIAATVPGCVHTDLLKAGKIPDPFYRDNENSVQWVGETNWKYKRAFQVSGELSDYPRTPFQ